MGTWDVRCWDRAGRANHGQPCNQRPAKGGGCPRGAVHIDAEGVKAPHAICVPVPANCTSPHLVTRALGQRASFISMDGKVTPQLPQGEYLVESTLLSCNFQAMDAAACTEPQPLSVFRRVLPFEDPGGRAPADGIWVLRSGATVDPATRYQLVKGQPSNHSGPIAAYRFIPSQYAVESWECICFVGASHARKMYHYAADLGLRRRYFKAQYARDLPGIAAKASGGSMFETGCSRILVHTAQWDLGWPEYRITPAADFVRDLQRGLAEFAAQFPPGAVYVLSSNYNPPGFAMMSCPPTDWRRPDYLDAYNLLTKEVAETHGFTYVDNNALIGGAAWDSATDWCHFDKPLMMNIMKHTFSKFQPLQPGPSALGPWVSTSRWSLLVLGAGAIAAFLSRKSCRPKAAG